MQPHDYAVELMDAAGADLYVLDALISDPAAPDSAVGFHCQQAVEKLLKAVLAQRAVHFRRSHDLNYLFGLVASSGSPAPEHLAELSSLNPFAAVLRYASSPSVSGFDRQRTRQLIEDLRLWAVSELSSAGEG